ncbi:MAG: hypothetical protein E6G05_15650 [Actinobacteria bacterium]|nr:MAG: hypothetical protein E6G05_15650 [Actinomycetota bacterium]
MTGPDERKSGRHRQIAASLGREALRGREHLPAAVNQRQVVVLLPSGIQRAGADHATSVSHFVLRDLLQRGLKEAVDQGRREHRALVNTGLDIVL